MFESYVCGLDIGSRKLAAAVARIRKGRIASLWCDVVPSRGIREGVIVDPIELVQAIGELMRRLRGKSGIGIKSICANLSGKDIITRRSRAIIPLVERGNKVVTHSDVQRANEQARILGSNLEEEIIHAVPFGYTLDSGDSIINPVGLYSHRLEVDLFLICGKASSIQSLVRVVGQSGYEIRDLFFSGIASSRVVYDDGIKEGVQAFCDIGSDITELVVYGDGLLKDVRILPVGSDYLTRRLSESLGLPFDLAEDVKRSYASIGDQEKIGEDKEILVKRENGYVPIKQREVADIITAEAAALCRLIQEALAKSSAAPNVNAVTVVGRSVLLDGFLETLETTLGIPVRLGRVCHPDMLRFVNADEALSGRKYLTYISALGLIAQALQDTSVPAASTATAISGNPLLRAAYKIKEVYQEYF